MPDKRKVPQGAAPVLDRAANTFDPSFPPGLPAPVPPSLQNVGFNGSIFDFNDRVMLAMQSHQAKHGQPPSPGLTLDVARSGVPTAQIPHLLSAPKTFGVAQNQKAIHNEFLQGGFLTVGHGGQLVPTSNPFSALAPLGDHPTTQQLDRYYPTTVAAQRAGFLPFDGFQSAARAAADQAKWFSSGILKITSEAASLADVVGLAKALPNAKDVVESALTHPGHQSDPNTVTRQEAINSIHSVVDLQKWVNEQAGTTLPVTGWLNDTWRSTISTYMSSQKYRDTTLAYQAQKQGYGTNVSRFENDVLAKKESLDAHPELAPVIGFLPTQAFGHGLLGGVTGVLDSLSGNDNPFHHPLAFIEAPVSNVLVPFEKTAMFALGAVGATVDEGKLQLQAAHAAFIQALGPAAFIAKFPDPVHPKTWFDHTQQSWRAAYWETLKKNPNWVRVLYPDVHDQEGWRNAAMQLANVMGDIAFLGSARFTGEKVPLGNIDRARNSRNIFQTSKAAYAEIVANRDLGAAAAMFSNSPGGEALVRAAYKPILDGRMTFEQFRQHVVDLHAQNITLVDVGKKGTLPVRGVILDNLYSGALPSPGTAGMKLIQGKKNIASMFDRVHARAAVNNGGGVADYSAHVLDTVATYARKEVAHAVPKKIAYTSPHLPEAVYNKVFELTGDGEQAKAFRSAAVGFRAKGDQGIPGMQRLAAKIDDLYYEKYPFAERGAQSEPFTAMLETEGAHYMSFRQRPLKGAVRNAETPAQTVANFSRNLGYALNTAAKYSARLVISGAPFAILPGPFAALGGMSLFWKHAVGDTLRRAVGGGFRDPRSVKRAWGDINTVLNKNPALAADFGEVKAAAEYGDVAYVNQEGATFARDFVVAPEGVRDFSASGKGFVGSPDGKIVRGKTATRQYYTGAGGYLRRHLDSGLLGAYLDASRTGDLRSFTDHVLRDDKARAAWKSFSRSTASETKTVVPSRFAAFSEEFPATTSVPGISAEEFAVLQYNEFAKLEQELTASGLNWEQAQTVLAGSRGASADRKLGQWLQDQGATVGVYHGQVGSAGWFDAATSRAVGLVMSPNKWNRGGMFRHLTAKWFDAAKATGLDDEAAVRYAMTVGRKQTVFHMLDFANQLQIEQDFRWVSYFATKHRLYWKWVMGLALRYPGYAAAVTDFKKLLSDNNTLDVTYHGQKLSIPFGRLVWVNNAELPQESGIFQTVVGLAHNPTDPLAAIDYAQTHMPFGVTFTRHDQTFQYLKRLAEAELRGGRYATVAGAEAGMTPERARAFNKKANVYRNEYFRANGHYPLEPQVVKHTLLESMTEEAWRAAMPVPVMPDHVSVGGVTVGEAPNEQQVALKKFYASDASRDPVKKHAYLAAHPDVAAYIGLSQDPTTLRLTQPLWREWSAAWEHKKTEDQAVYDEEVRNGWSPESEARRRAAAKALVDTRQRLLLRDAAAAGITVPKGGTPGRNGVPFGPWGKQSAADPAVQGAFDLHHEFPGIPLDQLLKGTGGIVRDTLQAELANLNDPITIKSYHDADQDDARKDRVRAVLDQLQVYRSYPVGAEGKTEAESLTRHVLPYWKWTDSEYKRIQGLPHTERGVAEAEFRAERDKRDRPYTVNGVRYPSPVRQAWAMTAPDVQHQRLSKLAGKDWEHLTDYEKERLGPVFMKDSSKVWSLLAEAADKYKSANNGATIGRDQMDAWAKQIDRVYPGFEKEYVFSQKPKIDRFHEMTVYRAMPARAKDQFDRVIGKPAEQVIGYLKAGYGRASMATYWQNYIRNQVEPWLDQPAQAGLKSELSFYGPDFLNTLIAGTVKKDG